MLPDPMELEPPDPPEEDDQGEVWEPPVLVRFPEEDSELPF